MACLFICLSQLKTENFAPAGKCGLVGDAAPVTGTVSSVFAADGLQE